LVNAGGLVGRGGVLAGVNGARLWLSATAWVSLRSTPSYGEVVLLPLWGRTDSRTRSAPTGRRRVGRVREQARSYEEHHRPVPSRLWLCLCLCLCLWLWPQRLPEKCPHAPTAPFRRPRRSGVSGVERHGCRESRDGPGMALRGVPLKLRFNEGIFRPKRKTGCPGQAFLVTSSAFGRSNSPEGAKHEARAHIEAALKHPSQRSTTQTMERGQASALPTDRGHGPLLQKSELTCRSGPCPRPRAWSAPATMRRTCRQ
jgi:hypothetical protein